MRYIFKFYLMDDNPQDFSKRIIQLIEKWENKKCCFIFNRMVEKTTLYIHLEWKKYNRQFKNFLSDLNSNAVKPYCYELQMFKEVNINL